MKIMNKVNDMPPHEPLGTSNIQHPTPNRQSMAQLETIGCSMLDVGCWMFSFGSWVQCANFSGNSFQEGPRLAARSRGATRPLPLRHAEAMKAVFADTSSSFSPRLIPRANCTSQPSLY